MIVQPFFIIGLIIVFVCLVLIVLAVVVLYFRSGKALSTLNTEFVLYKHDQETQSRQALLAATKKADEIITSTQIFSEEIKKIVLDAVSKSVQNGQNTYEQIIKDIGQKSIADILSYSTNLKKSIADEATQMTQSYKSELQNEEKTFQEVLTTNEQKIIEDIKVRALAMLPEILREVTSQTLTQEEIEASVISALETIKKNHGFS